MDSANNPRSSKESKDIRTVFSLTFSQNLHSTIDSAFWDFFKNDIQQFLECRDDYRILWKAISETLIVRSDKDQIAAGIWSHKPTKFSINPMEN